MRTPKDWMNINMVKSKFYFIFMKIKFVKCPRQISTEFERIPEVDRNIFLCKSRNLEKNDSSLDRKGIELLEESQVNSLI